MKKVKRLIAAAALALSAVMLASCGGQAGSATQSSQSSDGQLSHATYSNGDITMPDVTVPEVPSLTQGKFDNSPIDYESALKEASDHVIYFDDKIGWGDTYIYYWSDTNKKMVEWPGEKMESFQGVWRYTLPSDAEYIIFNNKALQTRDIPFNPNQNCYAQSTQQDDDNSYYVQDWQGNIINSNRVDPHGLNRTG